MADQTIILQIGERNMSLQQFKTATDSFVGLLLDMDAAISQKRKGFIRWGLSTLQLNGTASIGATAFVRQSRGPVEDIRRRVEREVLFGVKDLSERGERIASMSDSALRHVGRLAEIGPAIISVSSDGEPQYEPARIGPQTLDAVAELTRPQSLSYGTLFGKLEVISIHRGLEFRIWEDDTNRPVRCLLRTDQQSKAIALLGKKVSVDGMMKADREGRPLTVKVDAFEKRGESIPLPTLESLQGSVPGITGGRTLREIVEEWD